MNCSIRWSVAVALVWLTLAAPLARAQQAKAEKLASVEGLTEYKLANGARFLLFPDPASSSVTINMVVQVGSRHEGYGEYGMAHLLEHMNFKGTPTYPNKNDIDKALQEHGAPKANATTWLDRTNYYETMPASDKNLEFGIKLNADILVNSLIRKEDFDKEMTVVRNEFEMGENNPFMILSQRMTSAAFEWHNYGKSTIGNRSDIERVQMDNLRAFYRKYYQPDNIIVVIAGKFDEKKAIGFMEQYFGPLKKPERVLHQTWTEEPAQDGERSVTLRRVGNVPVVGVVYHIPGAAHPDFAALDVLTTVVSMQPRGLLYKEMVEKKKATGAGAGVGGFTHDPFLLEAFAQPAEGVSAEDCRDLLLGLLEKIGDGKISEEDVNLAKKKAKTDWDQQFAKSDQFAIDLCEWIGAGDWRLAFIHRDRVAKVTPDDVIAVAKKYLKRSNRTVGIFVPTKAPDRTPLPEMPDIAKLVGGYKGLGEIVAGEQFDATPENLEKRTKRLTIANLKAALLPKKTRGERVLGDITLRFGNEKALVGKSTPASYIGSLMMRGTTKRSYQEIQDQLDHLGATVSISSGSGTLSVSLECKRDKLAGVLDLIQDMLRNPIFPEKELDILKAANRQSYEKLLTDPSALARNYLQRQLNPFPKDNIHYVPTITESMERLDKMTRSDIVQIYNEQLGGAVGEIAFVGDFDEALVTKQIETMVKDWKSKTPYERIPGVVSLDVKGGKHKIETPDKENAVFIAGYQLAIDDNDPDYAALVLANYILGASGFNSRILDRVRQDEGLAYGAGSRFNASSLDKAAAWSLSAQSNPKNMVKLGKAMHEVIEKYAKEGVTDQKELDLAIRGLLEERRVDRTDDSSVLSYLASQAYLGRTFQRAIDFDKRLSSMTMEQLNGAIRRHFRPERFYIVEAGDFAKK
jgi:zinc protease